MSNLADKTENEINVKNKYHENEFDNKYRNTKINRMNNTENNGNLSNQLDSSNLLYDEYCNSHNSENKLLFQIMEKDKIIFEYSKTLKETEKVLEITKKLNIAKDEQITNLKDELKDIKFKHKNLENLIRHKDDEFEKFKNFTEEKIIYLNKDKSQLEEKLIELTNLYENNQKDFQNTLIEYKKIEKQLVKLKNNFGEKIEIIENYEKTFENLKNENKSISNLKKQICDMDNFINELKEKIQNDKKIIEKLSKEKEEIERKSSAYMEDFKNNKESASKNLKISYELESLQKECDEKTKEIENQIEKYKALLKDNDNFVYVITNEISQFTGILENCQFHRSQQYQHNLNTLTSNTFKVNNNPNFKNNNLSLKYELITKNFEILKSKIIDNYNNSNNLITKLEKGINETEKSNREISVEKDCNLKELSITKQKFEEFLEKNKELNNENKKLTEDLKSFKQNYLKIKTDHEDLIKINQESSKEIQKFVENCYNKLKDKFPEAYQYSYSSLNSSESSNFDSTNEKILYYIDILITEYNKLCSNEKQYLESMKMTQIQMKNIQDEKELLKLRADKIMQNKEDELKRADAVKSEELRRQREVLYEKISSMTSLLEESNEMISAYESENRELKEKLTKLEFNLKMLTSSHMELENSIAGNHSTLQNEVHDREYKYNQLLRELELKSLHIDSIENTLIRKEQDCENLRNELMKFYKIPETQDKVNNQSRIYDKLEQETEQYDPTSHFNSQKNFADNSRNFSSENNSKNIISLSYSPNSFKTNEENEKELRKLIDNYNVDEVSKEDTQQSNHSNINNNRGKILKVIKDQKVPGKIYSIKKN